MAHMIPLSTIQSTIYHPADHYSISTLSSLLLKSSHIQWQRWNACISKLHTLSGFLDLILSFRYLCTERIWLNQRSRS